VALEVPWGVFQPVSDCRERWVRLRVPARLLRRVVVVLESVAVVEEPGALETPLAVSDMVEELFVAGAVPVASSRAKAGALRVKARAARVAMFFIRISFTF
jgi:hypothetical protein